MRREESFNRESCWPDDRQTDKAAVSDRLAPRKSLSILYREMGAHLEARGLLWRRKVPGGAAGLQKW
jgi:hypothetical protein